MDYSFWLSILGLALGAVALGRTYVPPQRREVGELRQLVADLVTEVDEFGKRLTKRAQNANMEKARDVAAERVQRRDRIEQEALDVIEQAKAAKQTAPADPEQLRRQLRAQLLGKPH